MKFKFIPIVLSAVMLSACSSIVSKSEYSVAINSNPGGANFVVSNRSGHEVYSGITPSSVTLKSSAGYFKGETYTIVLNKEGYSTKTYILRSSVDGWYWGNFLIGGLIGMVVVDPATGAMYSLPARVDISIDPQTTSADPQMDLTIASIDSLTEEQIAQLSKIQ